MNKKVFEKKPPEQYVANFIEYVPGLDSNPDLIDFLLNGFSMKDAEKMRSLLAIESSKYYFQEAKEHGEVTEEESDEWQAQIENMIESYNKAP